MTFPSELSLHQCTKLLQHSHLVHNSHPHNFQLEGLLAYKSARSKALSTTSPNTFQTGVSKVDDALPHSSSHFSSLWAHCRVWLGIWPVAMWQFSPSLACFLPPLHSLWLSPQWVEWLVGHQPHSCARFPVPVRECSHLPTKTAAHQWGVSRYCWKQNNLYISTIECEITRFYRKNSLIQVNQTSLIASSCLLGWAAVDPLPFQR